MKSLLLLFLFLTLMQPNVTFCQNSTGNENWDARFFAPGVVYFPGNVLVSPSGEIFSTGGYNSSYGGFVDSIKASTFPKWNGSNWGSTVQRVISDATLLAVDSTGIYANGSFLAQNGDTIRGIAKWNGVNWNSMGIPPLFIHYNDSTYGQASITQFFLNKGHPIIMGRFDSSNGQKLGGIVRWEGDHWFTFKGGIQKISPDGNPISAAIIDSDNITISGPFSNIGDSVIYDLARWSDMDSTWHSVGNRFSPNGNINAIARQGNKLYVGGSFTNIGGKGIASIAYWDGADWFPIGNPKDVVIGSVSSIVLDGDLIHITGNLQKAGKFSVQSIATWNGKAWSDKFDRKDTIWNNYNYLHGFVPTLSDFFILNNKYYCITYTNQAPIYYSSLYRELHEWQDSIWVPVEKRNYLGFDGSVQSILAESDTSVFVAGKFRTLDGQSIENIARWNGTGWNRVTTDTIVGVISSMLKSGDSLFVGGNFYIKGTKIKHVAFLHNGKFQFLGRGMDSSVSSIYKLGGTLYAIFPYAYYNYWGIAFLADSGWKPLPESSHLESYATPFVLSQDFNGRLIAAGWRLCQFYDGYSWWNVGPDTILENSSTIINSIYSTNDNLFFGGRILTKDFSSNPILGILSRKGSIKYDSYFTMQYPDIAALAGRSDSDLYAIGNLYQELKGRSDNIYGISHYNGHGWESMGSGIDYNSLNAIATVGNEVYVGGSFFTAGDKRSSGFAIWHIPPPQNSVKENPKTIGGISIRIYPNPARQSAHVEITSSNPEHVVVSIYDPLGRKIVDLFHGLISQATHDFPISVENLPSGIYFLSLQGEGENYQTKFIVNH